MLEQINLNPYSGVNPTIFDDEAPKNQFHFISYENDQSLKQLTESPLLEHKFRVKNLLNEETLTGDFSLFVNYIAFCSLNSGTAEVISYLYVENSTISPKLQKFDGYHGFTLTKNSTIYEFISDDPTNITDWYIQLKTMCIQNDLYDQFKIVKTLGDGSTSKVLLAEQFETKTPFAIKEFNKSYLLEPGKEYHKAALINEIRILKQLKHENIAKLYEVYESPQYVYLVMEYAEGMTLGDYLITHTTTEIKSRIIMKSILRALVYLESKKIMHRDLKPGNIILTKQQNIKIIDFGLACSVETKNHIYERCGTPGYIAPEILTGDLKTCDEKCDMFALGLIFYFIIFKKEFFSGETSAHTLNDNRSYGTSHRSVMQIWAEFQNPHSLLNKAALILLMDMLALDPTKRMSATAAATNRYFCPNPSDMIPFEPQNQEEKKR
jgi:tRNA A-37 threonylcarbamoyl transferase component Bud32